MKRLAWIALAAAMLAPRLAAACGATPPPEWHLDAIAPAAGQALPTDGAIVIKRTRLEPVGEGSLDAAHPVVTVRDASNAEIAGTAGSYFDSGSSLVWTPKAPLPANATLSVEVTVGPPSSAPTATDGLKVSATLQTGAAPAPALHLDGELAVTYEAYDKPTFLACPSSCGGTCPPGAPLHMLRARVTIPPVSGGFAPTDYLAWLWISDDVPHSLPDGQNPGHLALGGIERLGDGKQATVAYRDVPAEDHDYAPCFAVRVFDPAGHFEDRTMCLPKVNVTATLAALDAAHSGTAGTGATTGAAGTGATGAAGTGGSSQANGGSGGCSVTGSRGTPNLGWLVLLAALAALRRRSTGSRCR